MKNYSGEVAVGAAVGHLITHVDWISYWVLQLWTSQPKFLYGDCPCRCLMS